MSSYDYINKKNKLNVDRTEIDTSTNQFDAFSNRGYVSTDEEGNPVVLDYDRIHRLSGIPTRPYNPLDGRDPQLCSVNSDPNSTTRPYNPLEGRDPQLCSVNSDPNSTTRPYNPLEGRDPQLCSVNSDPNSTTRPYNPLEGRSMDQCFCVDVGAGGIRINDTPASFCDFGADKSAIIKANEEFLSLVVKGDVEAILNELYRKYRIPKSELISGFNSFLEKNMSEYKCIKMPNK